MKHSHLFLIGAALASLHCGGDGKDTRDTSTTDTSTSTTDTSTSTTDTSATDTGTSATDASTSTTDTSTSTTDTDATVAPDAADTWNPVTYTYPACGTGADDLAGCVEEGKLNATLSSIVGPRYPGDGKWAAARDLCKSTFETLGFNTSIQPTPLGANVIGTKPGTTKADEVVIVGAHFDGVSGCDAADDNASGIAGLLETARILATGPHARTLVLACWDVEELGLIGSQIHAASVDPAKVVAVFNYEMIGFTNDAPNSQVFPTGFDQLFPAAKTQLDALGGRGVFIALIYGDDMRGPMQDFTTAAKAIGLPAVDVELARGLIGLSLLADLHRSDHAPFWARGVPAVQLTDTANFRNPNYHCPNGNTDTLASLDLPFMRAVVATTLVAAKKTLDAEDPTTGTPRTSACDIVAQDCGTGKRCSFVTDDQGSARKCTDLAASPAAVGEACTRPNSVIGDDTCAAGLNCAFYGGRRNAADPTQFDRICSPLCVIGSTCDGACIGVGFSFFEPTGLCRPRCADPFGTTCGEGQKCSPITRVEGGTAALVCMPTGSVAPGAECTRGEECGVGHGCFANADFSKRFCRPYCDGAHTCPNGLTCRPVTMEDLDTTLGACRE